MDSAKYNISKNKQGQRDKGRSSGALALPSFHTRVLGSGEAGPIAKPFCEHLKQSDTHFHTLDSPLL